MRIDIPYYMPGESIEDAEVRIMHYLVKKSGGDFHLATSKIDIEPKDLNKLERCFVKTYKLRPKKKPKKRNKYEKGKNQNIERSCLKCDKKFHTKSKFLRLCLDCRDRNSRSDGDQGYHIGG